MLRKYTRLIQPAGFFILLLFFLIPNRQIPFFLFWIGAALSLIGTGLEWYAFQRLTKNRKRDRRVIVFSGMVIKVLLIAAITLRVYEVNNSVFFLLGVILLAIIWGVVGYFYKPDRHDKDEFLDVRE